MNSLSVLHSRQAGGREVILVLMVSLGLHVALKIVLHNLGELSLVVFLCALWCCETQGRDWLDVGDGDIGLRLPLPLVSVHLGDPCIISHKHVAPCPLVHTCCLLSN